MPRILIDVGQPSKKLGPYTPLGGQYFLFGFARH